MNQNWWAISLGIIIVILVLVIIGLIVVLMKHIQALQTPVSNINQQITAIQDFGKTMQQQTQSIQQCTAVSMNQFSSFNKNYRRYRKVRRFFRK